MLLAGEVAVLSFPQAESTAAKAPATSQIRQLNFPTVLMLKNLAGPLQARIRHLADIHAQGAALPGGAARDIR